MNTKSILETAQRITETIIQFNQNKKDFKTQIPEKELITLGEAIDKYQIPDYGKEYGDAYDDMVLVFKGDVAINENLAQWFEKQLDGLYWETSLMGVLIDGNLSVNGDVEIGDFMKLVVKKDLECDYVESFRGFLEVQGNATVRYGVLGVDYIGGFAVGDKLSVPYLVSSGLEMPLKADLEASIYIQIKNGISVKTNDTDFYENVQSLFKENICQNDNFDSETFFEIVRNGENPFINLKQ